MSQRILVIDDDPDILGVITGYLEDDGFEVETAPNGMQGLAKATASPPDLVLLDVMMPEMNGMDVFKQLRKQPETVGVPVIFLTALQERKYIKAALLAGIDQYITKPFDFNDLLGKVRSTLADSV